MKNLFTYCLFLFVFFISVPLLAQNNSVIDSLENVLKTAKEDTTKVNALLALSYQFKSNDPDTAIYFGNEALALATKLNYKLGMADAYWRMGQANVNLGKYEDALKSSNNAFALYDQLLAAEKTTDKTDILKKKSGIYNLLGQIYYMQGKYVESLKVNSEALKIREQVGDKVGYSSSLVSIGNIYYAQGDFDNALTSYQAALKIREELGEKSGIADCYSNIGIIYWEQEKDSLAVKNYLASLSIRKEIGDKKGIATTYNNLGSLYFAVANYDEALKNYFLALNIRNEINDMLGVATTCNNIGNIYSLQKKYKDASVYLNKGIALSNEIGSLEDIKEGYQWLTAVDSAQGNYKQAFEHHKLYIAYRDSLVNEDNIKKMAEAQMQFEFDKKETLAKAEQDKKDAIQLKEMQKQKLVRNGILLGAAFLVLMTILFFNRYQLRKKLEQQTAINLERKRISADLHDDIGATLSSISIFSEAAAQKLKKANTDDAKNLLERISSDSQEMVSVMSDFVWTLNPANDSFQKIMDRMQSFASPVLSAKNIRMNFEADESLHTVSLKPDVRKNVFLIFKEAINNAAKYSDAAEVNINMKAINGSIEMLIADNGKGFNNAHPVSGNGLKNMQMRTEEINAKLDVSSNGQGTKIKLKMELASQI